VREVCLPHMPEGTKENANNRPSLDYLFQLAIEMKKLGLSWLADIA